MLDGIIARAGVVAAVANMTLCAIAIMTILAAIRIIRKEGVTELNNVSTILPTVLDSISHSENSVLIVATIANCMKIPLYEIIKEYEEDSVRRRYNALVIFRNDSLTWKLIWKFPSKFITYGYIGEEQLIKATR